MSPMRLRAATTALFAAAVWLALACGGGGGGQADRPLEELASGPADPPAEARNEAGGSGPTDRGPAASSEAPPKVHFAYAVHVHWESDQPGIPLSWTTFRDIRDGVRAMALVLEEHGARGTFLCVPNFTKAVAQYEGTTDNTLHRLVATGHEVGVHTHTAPMFQEGYDAILAAGLPAARTHGGRAGPDGDSIELARQTGFRIEIENRGPDKRTPDPICPDAWGDPANTMDLYNLTRTFPVPWRPAASDFCSHDPQGTLLFLHQVAPTWITQTGWSDALTRTDFSMLQPYFEASVAQAVPGKTNLWAFVTHVSEYLSGSGETGAVSLTSLAALDQFLTVVDGYVAAGNVTYSTASEAEAAYAPPPQAAYPIDLFVMVHLDPLARYEPPRPVPVATYQAERDNLKWLADYTAATAAAGGPAYQPRLAIEIGGDHAQEYLRDSTGLQYLRQYHASGVHTFGMHWHKQYRISMGPPPVWQEMTNTRENAVLITQQEVGLVDQLVGRVIGSTDASAIRAANAYGGAHMWDWNTAWDAGIQWAVGGAGETLNIFFDHEAYNPWRWGGAQGFPALRPSGSLPAVIEMPIPTMLGFIGRHAPSRFLDSNVSDSRTWIWQDGSVAAFQRKFLFVYLEWLYCLRTNQPAKVWLFGFAEHTNNLYGNDGEEGNPRQYRDEVEQFVAWLNGSFIQSRTAEGYLACRWAKPGEVAADFERWESENPGASSFSFPTSEVPWDGTTDADEWQLYPYELGGLAKELMYSHYVREVTGFPGARVHEFQRVEVAVSPNTVPVGTGQIPWTFQGGQVVPSAGLATRTIYVAWREAATGTATIGTQLLLGADTAVVIDGASGLPSTATDAVTLATAPVVIYKP